jgi:hypothetical protein
MKICIELYVVFYIVILESLISPVTCRLPGALLLVVYFIIKAKYTFDVECCICDKLAVTDRAPELLYVHVGSCNADECKQLSHSYQINDISTPISLQFLLT